MKEEASVDVHAAGGLLLLGGALVVRVDRDVQVAERHLGDLHHLLVVPLSLPSLLALAGSLPEVRRTESPGVVNGIEPIFSLSLLRIPASFSFLSTELAT